MSFSFLPMTWVGEMIERFREVHGAIEKDYDRAKGEQATLRESTRLPGGEGLEKHRLLPQIVAEEKE